MENHQNNQSNQSAQSNQSSQSILNSQSNQNCPITPITPTPPPPAPFLPQHGYYRNLRVYRLTEIIYDATYYFTQHYLNKPDRTIDQMVQAARSGKQNIAEGNQAAITSSETEIKLTNVAKASLEELLTDYEDYLRVHDMEQWQPHHPRVEKMRTFVRGQEFLDTYALLLPKLSPEELCNLCITLIHQAIYMLHRLIETMQRRFLTEGGIKEQMYRARVNYRNNQSNQNNQSAQSTQSTPNNQSAQSAQSTPNNQSNQSTPSTQTNPTTPTTPTTPPPPPTTNPPHTS